MSGAERAGCGAAGAPWPLCVIGAGAAGLLAALFAARGGARTLLLESQRRPGAKIRVSGGGRCNVLPSSVSLDDFHTEGSRHALRNLLFSWPLEDVRAFFERELGIALKTEATGKVFPESEDPNEVVGALLAACQRAGVALAAGARVRELRRCDPGGPGGGRFALELAGGESVRAVRVALCTGGLSLPKTGSDGWGYRIAAQLGHRLLPTYPALVPLLSSEPRWKELAGVSLPARLSALRGGAVLEARTGDLLFTHKGVSGPVVLDQSHHRTRAPDSGVELRAAWRGDDAAVWEARLLQGGARSVQAALREWLPRRLVDVLLALAAVAPDRALARLAREERKRLLGVLADCPLEISGDEGYRSAEVTGGGVPLVEVSTRTLESRLVPGLYLAGEILDVTGRIGGFNFLWAWVSGRRVGLSVAADCAAR